MFKEKYPIHPNARDYALPADGERAVLFIHGFTETPYHFREYAEHFHRAGFHVRALRLPGHGSDIRDLVASSYLDWREAVHNELQTLAAAKSKIYLLGYSFGGNLALDAAREYPQLVAGMILVSPSFILRRDKWLRFTLRFYDRYTWVKYRRKPFLRSRRRLRAYQQSGGYVYIPIKSALDFFYFIDHFCKPHLKDINNPCLILQSEQDPLVGPDNAQFVYNHLGATDKKLVILDSDEHILLSDEIRRQAFEDALNFLSSH